MVGTRHFRPRQMTDIQYNITIVGGRKVSRPYRVWFFAEGERFYPFGDATDLVRGWRRDCVVGGMETRFQ